jgi:hypothetical protein
MKQPMKQPSPSDIAPVVPLPHPSSAERERLEKASEPGSRLLYSEEDKLDLSVWIDEGGA